MRSDYHYPLPTGSKLAMSRRPGMDRVLDLLLYAPDGMITAADIRAETDMPMDTIAGYLRLLKMYGIVGNTHAKAGHGKLWWIVPALRNSLAIFSASLRVTE